MDEISPIIKIENFNKTFLLNSEKITVLDDINLEIEQGDIFGIIGESGAGKSTLVRCMNYLEKPTSGRIIVDGQDLSRLTEKQLREARRSICMIFQQFNLLMQRTAEKNILFPLEIAGVGKQEAKARAKELLELVGLSDKADNYPSQLSGGQKQRVAIARALAVNPKVILCDEATSALDPATTRSILALLKDINKRLGITIVVVTHEMGVIEEICQHVAIIDKSKIVEVGKVQEIFAHPKTQAAQRLVYPDAKKMERFIGKRCCRIVFDGSSSYSPTVASMILECKAPVNIMYADMRDIDGVAFGELVLQLPEDKTLASKVVGYFRTHNLFVEELGDHAG